MASDDVTMKTEEAAPETKDETKEEAKEDDKLKPKVPEKSLETEEDAPADSRSKVNADSVQINSSESTLNALPVVGGNLLTCLSDGAFQNLLAGVRLNTGVKAGRYMLEFKVIEAGNPTGGRPPAAGAFHVLRVGLSLAGSSVLLSDGADSVYFDYTESNFVHGKTRKKSTLGPVARVGISKNTTAALLINLDPSSPNANTVSLFKDGKRISEPQALPESLHGQCLFPTITYRNITLQLNFGPDAMVPLPFSCRLLNDAAAEDVQIVQDAASGKGEVVLPVGLPEKGYFDFVDAFLEANPSFTELSDRKLLEWAAKSGLSAPKGGTNDKPTMPANSGLEDRSAGKTILAVASQTRRNYIVPELKSNLLPRERKAVLAHFAPSKFKRKASVLLGEPSADHKAKVRNLLLAGKRAKAEAVREAARKQKMAEANRKKAEAARLKAIEKKKKEAEKAKRAAQRKKDGFSEEEDEAEELEEEAKEDMEMEEEPPIALELTEEEQALWYRKTDQKDVAPEFVAKLYKDFALPTGEEGFDEVSFEWQPESSAADIFKEYMLSMKMSSRVDDLKPGEWFKENLEKFEKELKAWKTKQAEFKVPAKKQAMIDAKKAALKKDAAEGEDAGDVELPEIEAGSVDVMSVEDVTDLGNCEPLFAKFEHEDWILLELRYHFHLMILSWKKDVDDADRPSFSDTHFPFYYQKYFKKPFNPRQYSAASVADVAAYIKDTISISSDNGFLSTSTDEDTACSQFVKLTEKHRRDRLRRVDAGDEGSLIKFPKGLAGTPAQATQGPSKVFPLTARPAAAVARPGLPPRPAAAAGARPVVSLRPTGAGIRAAAARPATFQGAAGPRPAPAVLRPTGAVARPAGSVGALVRPAGTVGALKRPLTPVIAARPAKAPKMIPSLTPRG